MYFSFVVLFLQEYQTLERESVFVERASVSYFINYCDCNWQ